MFPLLINTLKPVKSFLTGFNCTQGGNRTRTPRSIGF
jgi:hypothetical protein